jgi:hypothetical protein
MSCVQILSADDDYVLGNIAMGGVGGTVAEGGSGGTADGGSGGAGGAMCGQAATPPGGTCPAECNGGCDNDVCLIDCTQTDCRTVPVVCPADFACDVQCGPMNCRNAMITCPAAHACNVSCSGNQACRDATLTCSDGPCSVACAGGCGMDVVCGSNACTVDPCDALNNPTLECGESCSCEGCS